MSQDVLGILKPLSHLCIVTFQGMVERERLSLALLVDIGHLSILRVKQDLCVILEVHLHDLVRETEHNCVLGAHPLLHVDWCNACHWLSLW